jgi:hypothetical protein
MEEIYFYLLNSEDDLNIEDCYSQLIHTLKRNKSPSSP